MEPLRSSGGLQSLPAIGALSGEWKATGMPVVNLSLQQHLLDEPRMVAESSTF